MDVPDVYQLSKSVIEANVESMQDFHAFEENCGSKVWSFPGEMERRKPILESW